jgi:malonyl-CoA/methylmalonyl-CoA synthetase
MTNDNLYARLAAHFPERRDDVAIETHDGLYWTWRDLERASARMANLLASLRLPVGSRVAVQVEKSPEAAVLYLATLRAGHVFVPLNSGYRQAEIEYFVGDAEPAVVVCAPAAAQWIEPIATARGARVLTLGDDRRGTLLESAAAHADTFDTVPRSETDLAAILYTSGTTGRSKGAMLSHGNLASNADVLHRYWRWRPGDVLLHALPIFHVHGLFVALHGALRSGSPMIWLPRFDPKDVARRLPRATVFMGVPTMYVRLLDEPSFDAEAARGMRLFVSGSAPLLADTFRQFEARTGHRILERYGMSETVMLASNPYDGDRVPGTVGLPLRRCRRGGRRRRRAGARPRDRRRAGARGPEPCSRATGGCPGNDGGVQPRGWSARATSGTAGRQRLPAIVGRSKDLIISGRLNIVYPKGDRVVPRRARRRGGVGRWSAGRTRPSARR